MLTTLIVPPPFFHAAIGHLPSGDQLQHVAEFGLDIGISTDTSSTSRPSAPVLLSCGLPPVPVKLVKRIQDGLFIEMSKTFTRKVDNSRV